MVVPDWENRVGSSFQGAPTTERFYFFEQAYKDYLANSNQQAPAPIPFAEVEKKLDNTYNPEFTSILNEHNVATNGKNCIDPFNDSDVSGLTTQLCGLGTQYKGGQPFVDLCIILNKHEMAFDFAKQHNEKYAILDLITSCSVEARVKVFHDSAAEQMITCHTDDNQDAIRLSALVYRAVEQEQSAFELIVAELWSMGYRWDAFCLIQLKQRGSKFANILEVYTRKYIPNGEPIPSKPSIIQSLVKSVLEEAVVEVDPILLKDENPIHLYRLLKSSMMKNELCENDFDKLAGRRNTPTRLRQIILATLIKIGPKEAVLMTEDIFAYLKTNPCLLTDCFYILHRMMFLLTVGMIADVYEAIQKATSSNASVERAMVDKIKFDWEKRDFNFWIDDRRPVVFKEICSSLAETLATIRPYCESSHSVNFAYGQLAIAMSNVIASGTRSSNDREALASLVRETAGIPSDSKGQITSAIQDTAQPKTTAPSSEEEHNIKVNSLESSGPAVSDITVESNEVPDISSHHRSQPSTKSVSAPVLTIGADEARTEEEPKANIVKPDENTVPKEDAANAEEPTAIKSSTVLNLKSGGFEIQDSQKSRFGMYEVGRTQQSSLPSHYNEKRGGFGSRGGRGSAQFQGGRGGNTNGFRGSSSTGFGGFGNL